MATKRTKEEILRALDSGINEFSNLTILDVTFYRKAFINIHFRNVYFANVSFDFCTFDMVHFDNCTFIGCKWLNLVQENVEHTSCTYYRLTGTNVSLFLDNTPPTDSEDDEF